MKSTYIEQSASFIEEIGYLNLAKDLSVTPQAVVNWRSRGIPRAYLKYLNIAYKAIISKFNLLLVL